MQDPSTHIGMCLPTRHIGMDLSFHAGPVHPISMCLPSRHIGYVFHPITSGCDLHPVTPGCPTTSGCLPSSELIGMCLASSNRDVSSIPTRGWRSRCMRHQIHIVACSFPSHDIGMCLLSKHSGMCLPHPTPQPPNRSEPPPAALFPSHAARADSEFPYIITALVSFLEYI